MAFWTYILKCADGRYYTGHTENLEIRLAQHQAGGYCDFTSRRRPVQLMWSQDFQSRIEALEAERRIKPWSRAKKEALIRGDWPALSYFARPPKERPSTSLGTNESKGGKTKPLVSSENAPFASSENAPFVSSENAPFVSSEVETRPSPSPSRTAGGEDR